jgi:hypothetical protein
MLKENGKSEVSGATAEAAYRVEIEGLERDVGHRIYANVASTVTGFLQRRRGP